MRILRVLSKVLMAAMFAFIVSSCSDDDSGSVTIIGTWKVVLCDDISEFVNNVLVFEPNGNVSGGALKEFYEGDDYYATWKMDGNALTIVLGSDLPDDQLVGTITFKGKTATYNYYWEDCSGGWSDKDSEHNVMILEKQ